MNRRTYFLVNDTRYDNHHGGLTVVRNLHLGMARRGWTCVGSLPVSSTVSRLKRHRREIHAARLIIVNGEGSLHHDSRNAGRLFEICDTLAATHPVALVNAVWQQNDPSRWKPLLQRFRAVYARDPRSREALRALGIPADCAPDLTFYDYPRFDSKPRPLYACTDSVLKTWTRSVSRLCERDGEIEFLSLFTGELQYARGLRDWDKAFKHRVYPMLWKTLKVPVPPRFRSSPATIRDTAAFLERLASCRAVCAARYHALCFALQQNIPFLAVASNSHKSEALLEEAGLSFARHAIDPSQTDHIKERLQQAATDHPSVRERIEAFNHRARERIEALFDSITEIT